MVKIVVTPGTMYAAYLCLCLFDKEKVIPNMWTQPVEVFNLTKEEALIGKELLEEKGFTVEIREQSYRY